MRAARRAVFVLIWQKINVSYMIKNILRLCTPIAIAVIIASCGKDEVKKQASNEPEFPTQFSELTTEQNKMKLQENGIDFINNLTALKQTEGIQLAIVLSSHLDGSTLPENFSGGRVGETAPFNLIKSLSQLGKGSTSGERALSGMRTSVVEFESFQQYYNDVKGVYTYNKASKSWAFAQQGNSIVFKFPSTKTSSTNNAEFTIYGYEGVTINSELGNDYNGDYPKALKADLAIGGSKKMEFTFGATYNTGGDPASVSVSIKLGDFLMSLEALNTVTEAKSDYVITRSGANILSFGVRATGTLSSNGAETNGVSTVTKATAYFQVMNIKVSGEINPGDLDNDFDMATNINQKADAWNNNTKFVAYYADSKKKIADVEFYGTTKQENYYGCDYDYIDGEYIETNCRDDYYTYIDEAVEVRLIFADGSKADLETYTAVGFSTLETKYDEFIEALEADLK